MTVPTEPKRPVEITRDELYRQVWEKPMSKLALEYGITGNGLAKICDRMQVPYPPRGYWAKKAAGKKVITYRLPDPHTSVPQSARITPTPPPLKPVETPPEVQARLKEIEKGAPIVKDRLLRPHKLVAKWLDERERRRREARANRDDWGPSDPGKFTDTDQRRHRILDALFKELERHGGKVTEEKRDELRVERQGEKIEFQLREKQKQIRHAVREEDRSWRKFEQELQPTGKLIFSIKTHMPQGIRSEWLETDDKAMESLVPEILSSLLAAVPLLVQRRQEQEELGRQRRNEEQKRREEEDRRKLARNRVRKFVEFAEEWKNVQVAREFLAAIRSQDVDTEAKVGTTNLSNWLSFMEKTLNEFDPLSQGPVHVFAQVAQVQSWSYRD